MPLAESRRYTRRRGGRGAAAAFLETIDDLLLVKR